MRVVFSELEAAQRLTGSKAKAKIWLHLRGRQWVGSEEIAEATDIFPSTVRESVYEMSLEGLIDRRTAESDRVGHPGYEYRAKAPSVALEELCTKLEEPLRAGEVVKP